MKQEGTLQRNIFQRLFGICATQKPHDEGCWTIDNNRIDIDLSRAPKLSKPDGAIRLEGKNLPVRVLVVHGNDGHYHAFRNYCTHAKRRLDPIPGTDQVQCCSVGKSTFSYTGDIISGSAKKPRPALQITEEAGRFKLVWT